MNRNRKQGNNFPTGHPNRNWQDFDDSNNYQNEGNAFRGQHSGRYGQGSFGRGGESYGNSIYNSGRQQNLGRNSSQWQGNYDRGYAGGNRDFISEGNQNLGRGDAARQSGRPGRQFGYGEASYPKGGGRNYGGMNADYQSGEQYENYGFDDSNEGGYGAGTGTGQFMGGTQGFGRTDFEDYGTSRAGRNYGGIYDNAYNYETGARDYEGDMEGGWRQGGNYGGGYGGGTRGGGSYGQGGFGSVGGSYSGRGGAENYNSFRGETGDYEDSAYERRNPYAQRGRNQNRRDEWDY